MGEWKDVKCSKCERIMTVKKEEPETGLVCLKCFDNIFSDTMGMSIDEHIKKT